MLSAVHDGDFTASGETQSLICLFEMFGLTSSKSEVLIVLTLYQPSSCQLILHDAMCDVLYVCLVSAGQQFEDLKKAKEDLVDEVAKEKSAHKLYKKECSALKAEYNIIRLKV